MRKLALLLATFCLFTINSIAQSTTDVEAIAPSDDYENITVQKLYSDAEVSSFAIWIKKEVKAHKHVNHTEHVHILEGTATMTLGDEIFDVKPGMLIFIPKNTVHSVVVTSKTPLKVISYQAPEFKGKDRVYVEE